MLQGCLNGGRSVDEHPAVPVTPGELAAAAASAAALGVVSVHIHPRDAGGAESVEAGDVGAAVAAIRARLPEVEVGVTTAAWIEPAPSRRLRQVAAWSSLGGDRPDLASVNVHEEGWQQLCAALQEAGIGVELGVFHTEAAGILRAAGVPANAVRVLAEVQPTTPAEAVEAAGHLLEALSWIELPLLLHGEEAGAWPVLLEATRRSLDIRMGLEDTLWLPTGEVADDNTALLEVARSLVA